MRIKNRIKILWYDYFGVSGILSRVKIFFFNHIVYGIPVKISLSRIRLIVLNLFLFKMMVGELQSDRF